MRCVNIACLSFLFNCFGFLYCSDLYFFKKGKELVEIHIEFEETNHSWFFNSKEDLKNKFFVEDSKFFFSIDDCKFKYKNIFAYIKENDKCFLIGKINFAKDCCLDSCIIENGKVVALSLKNFIDIRILDVHRDYQNIGIGSLLIKKLLESYPKENFTLLSTIDSVPFYEKIGFSQDLNYSGINYKKFYLFNDKTAVKNTIDLINKNKNIQFDKTYKRDVLYWLYCSCNFNGVYL